MQNVVRVIAAIVDTHQLTLYKENGETIVFPQGDPRVRYLLDLVTPKLLKNGWADIEIPNEANTYSTFEEQSNGVVKFFRVAKSKLMGLFTMKVENEPKAEPVHPIALGTLGMLATAPKVKKTMDAVEEILQHATPVTSNTFTEVGLDHQANVVEANGSTPGSHTVSDSPDTIVAVVDGKVIPGMEKIKTQFNRAAKLGSTQGVENFLKRLGAVVEQRSHSVEDLLKFMERGDLPIADDGSILIYKVLRRKGERTNGKFVDCHTSKVEQWTGAYVCMDPSLVDHNRNNECSNGLHVARRGYVKGFSGDVCVLAKLAPEDVIAVPSYDANKMRVCGYHIIMELTDAQYSLLKNNRPITEDAEGKVLLANALAGKHIGKTQEVRITGHMGANVVTTNLTTQASVKQPVVGIPMKEAEALSNPETKIGDHPINPKDVVKQVEQLSRKEQAARFVKAFEEATTAEGKVAAVDALRALKKASKVGWDKLGISQKDLAKFVLTPDSFKPKTNGISPALISAAANAIEEFGEDELERYRDEQEAKKTKPISTKKIDFEPKAEGSPRERIGKLLAVGLTSKGVAQAVLNLKKQSKKSWSTLGISEAKAKEIIELADRS